MNADLRWTGERLVPSVLDETAVEHLARYAFCLPFITGKKVLDLASGEGYGSWLLTGKALSVMGVDLDERTILHAQKRYRKTNLKFTQGSVLSIPAEDGAFDVVVSFETIEHIKEQQQMMAEIRRVLKNDGLLIISTPNKKTGSAREGVSNPFHQKELDKEEFKTLLDGTFKNVAFFFQQNMYGSFIYPENNGMQKIEEMTGSFQQLSAENYMAQPCYFVALASHAPLPFMNPLFFSAANIYEERFEALKKTATYKLGAALLYPVKWMRSFFSK